MHGDGSAEVQVRGLGFDLSRIVSGDTNCDVKVRGIWL